jgi:hypothetical protein
LRESKKQRKRELNEKGGIVNNIGETTPFSELTTPEAQALCKWPENVEKIKLVRC